MTGEIMNQIFSKVETLAEKCIREENEQRARIFNGIVEDIGDCVVESMMSKWGQCRIEIRIGTATHKVSFEISRIRRPGQYRYDRKNGPFQITVGGYGKKKCFREKKDGSINYTGISEAIVNSAK